MSDCFKGIGKVGYEGPDSVKRTVSENSDPKPRSGRQEYLENLINRFV